MGLSIQQGILVQKGVQLLPGMVHDGIQDRKGSGRLGVALKEVQADSLPAELFAAVKLPAADGVDIVVALQTVAEIVNPLLLLLHRISLQIIIFYKAKQCFFSSPVQNAQHPFEFP